MKAAKGIYTFNSLDFPLFSKKAGERIVIQALFLLTLIFILRNTTKLGGFRPVSKGKEEPGLSLPEEFLFGFYSYTGHNEMCAFQRSQLQHYLKDIYIYIYMFMMHLKSICL